MKVSARLAGKGLNKWYGGNRAPLVPSPLVKLPCGAVRPLGWLREQLERMGSGLTGRLTELSAFCQYEKSAWARPDGEGERGWEELPYWLRGLTSLAYLLDDPKLKKEAQRWIEPILASQTKEGYFGPRENWRHRDLWPNMLVLYVLRTHFEATGDRRILSFMTKYCQFLNTIPLEQFLPGSWQKWRGGDLLDSVLWLYNKTGNTSLLELARTIHQRTADWSGGIPTWHGVNICQGFREPAIYYQQSGDPRYLAAAERNYDTVMGTYGQFPGGMFAADENCREGYTGPQQAAETCSMSEFIHSHALMTKITGQSLWADRCEEVAFNSLPAALTPDIKGLHYLTGANMVQLDREDKSPYLQNGGTMLSYSATEPAYRCCLHNFSIGWTYFTEYLWMATLDEGLAAVLYAPCQVQAKAGDGTLVTLTVETDYPFSEDIRITVTPKRPISFPLTLRIPGWCDQAQILVNKKAVRGRWSAGDFVTLTRPWVKGDEVLLRLPMSLKVKVWEKQGGAVSVTYGPLAFSLKIGERWVRYGGTDDWPAYEVFPTTPWNYGLLVDPKEPERYLKIVREDRPLPEQPFVSDGSPIWIQAKGRRLPSWQMVGGIVGPLPKSPVTSDQPLEDLQLIPMGCARLRLTVFPLLTE
ncbi:MAG: glycoside hydrolase family 127 protein [Armatimonadetes bacterium]|nr:glycoside hydrolase family 127 protein [Armatimonadota bacterium]MDW8121372.1 glycoside hydrolase family 127 protein [Armatimonadota bacterium]